MRAGNVIEMPNGITVVIIMYSWSLVSAKTNINLPTAYKVSPNISDPLTPTLSIINPLIVNPKQNKHKAEIQNKIPASEGVILYSY